MGINERERKREEESAVFLMSANRAQQSQRSGDCPHSGCSQHAVDNIARARRSGHKRHYRGTCIYCGENKNRVRR